MSDLFPAIEPYASGLLDVGDGQTIYWEECGRRDRAPAVVLHGGPGSGCTDEMRRFFDPDRYRIVLVDQRGCGRSTPRASDPSVGLSVNTTEHLLQDLEIVRTSLDIERWLVFGVSWGSVLGLAYAERHPERVTGLVLAGVSLGRHAEIDWLYRGGLQPFFPEEWHHFRAGVPEALADDLVAGYHSLLEDPDPTIRAAAADRWTDWDLTISSVSSSAQRSGRWRDPMFVYTRARLCAHYFHHNMWLEDGVLVQHADALAGIPGVLVNGRLDLGSPLGRAWELARLWATAELVVVEGAGHSTADRGMGAAIVAATNRLATHR